MDGSTSSTSDTTSPTWRDYYVASKRLRYFFVAPLIFAIVPLYFQTKAAACAFVVLYMGYLWITEAIPMAVTSLIPLVAYPLLGIYDAKSLSGEYLNDTNFVFFGSLLTAIGVETTRLHERIALKVLRITGTNPRWLMLGLQSSTALLSMWMSNTATAAMMLPIVISIIQELDYCHRRHQSPNDIIVKQNAANLDFSLSTKRDREIYKGLLLSICFSASIGGTGTIIGTGPNIILAGYMEQLTNGNSPITFAKWMFYAVPQLVVMILFLWFWLQFLYVGWSTDPNAKETEKILQKVIKSKYDALGPIKYSEKTIAVLFSFMVVLWTFRDPKVVPGWGDLFPNGYVSDATVSICIGILLFVLPRVPLHEYVRTSTFDKAPSDPPAIITWKDMHERFSWGTILLLGGGFAMAKGVESSGLSAVISSQLTRIENVPEWAFVLFSCILVTALTEFSSNIATASIFIPLVANIAQKHNVNVLTYVLPATLSCSFAFMLPAGTPPNAIVFSAGLLKVTDMVKAGVVLNLFGFLLIFTATHTYAPYIFDLHLQSH
uniref:Protein I'm not dead yet n=1 Tax=Panagrellus redivivus TaxID=6233 RepID=A0A7E4V4F1_PANRE